MSLHDPRHQARIAGHLAKYPDRRSAVMPLLYIAQEEYGWVSPQGIREVAEICEMDPTQVKSIAGFYTMYSERVKGRHWLHVCTDLPCALNGAEEFYRELMDYLEVEDGGTSADGLFTVEHVMCLAACDKAPMMQCNFRYMESLDIEKVKAWVDERRAEAAAAGQGG